MIVAVERPKNSNFALYVYKKHNRYDSTSIVVNKASGKYKEIKSIDNSEIVTTIDIAYTANHRRVHPDTVRKQDFIYVLRHNNALLLYSIDGWIAIVVY